MATHYTVQAARRTVEVKSPSLVVDVMEVHAITKPSGVTFVRNVPYDTWKKSGPGPTIGVIADHIEHIFAVRPHVVSGAAIQQVGSNGLLVNAVEFVVQVDGTEDDAPGPFTSTVDIPVQVLHDQDSYDGYFTPVIDQLTKTAAS